MNKLLNKDIRILYVEDDDIARENGVEYLENYFDNIYEASDAIIALQLYDKHTPDIIITDIQMPKMDGLEFVKRIREKDEKTQIIIITAFSHKEYLLKAIELKLVKYLIKPVKENELHLALEASVNSIKDELSNVFELNAHSHYDIFNQTLLTDDKIVKLRTKEILLLNLLLKNKNRYVTYQEIENYVWKSDYMSKDALKTLIKNIKIKLPDDLILNLSGTGYKIDV